MAEELTKVEKIIYIAIEELTKESPDGELTYTKILVCYLNGKANEDIPWSAIQKSKVYGKLLKANAMSVILACNKLESLGYLRIAKIGGNYKYFLTNTKPKEDNRQKLFSEKITTYKKYLLNSFITYLNSFCPSLEGVEHENYYGFVNKNPISFNEYNWLWVNDGSNQPNTLKICMRYRPNVKPISDTFDLSKTSFNTVLEEIGELLIEQKETYKLTINKEAEFPQLEEPPKPKPDSNVADEPTDISFFDEEGEKSIHINDGGKESLNVSLTVSEASPYNYSGDTLFFPKTLKKQFQGKSRFDFSFLKWKIVAWTTMMRDETPFIQNVLLVSKKNNESFIFLSIPKKKVLCITTNKFSININGETISSEEIVSQLLKAIKK